jgi:hypothetical protein
VVGGAAFLEIKWIERTGQWHPHIHCIVEGRYFPKQLLSSQWHAVTGDSYVTDIRAIQDEAKISQYVVKYASKASNDTFINRAACLDTVIACCVGRRLCLTFGTWRGLRLTESPNERDWESLGSFHEVALYAAQGDAESMAAIAMIAGSRYAEVLEAVEVARPPPIKTKPVDAQLHFQFAFDDTRPF